MEEGGFGSDLAYDLRQRYAKIVGDHLEDITQFRKERRYSDYFRALEDLYTIVQHKFKNPTEKKTIIIKKKGSKDTKKEVNYSYSDLRNDITNISTECPYGRSGEGTNPNEIAKIETALRNAEMFLYKKMDDANMFGSKRETEGLI